MNHSCDPSCWFEGNYLMTATRDLAVGDEVTFDYSTSNDWPQDWTCMCGSSLCRGRITGQEWKDAELAKRYEGHFLPHIAARVAAAAAEGK
jgi:uncharacterized protein